MRAKKDEITTVHRLLHSNHSLSPFVVSVPLKLNRLIKLDIYWRKQIKVFGLGVAPLTILFVCVSWNTLIPGQQLATKIIGLKGIQFKTMQGLFLKGSAVLLVVEVYLAE